MPRNGVEPLSFELQSNALTLKQPKLINMENFNIYYFSLEKDRLELSLQ